MTPVQPAELLSIRHGQRGCHVWSNGWARSPMMRLHVRLGQKLSIADMDVDAHQLTELSGPAHLRLGCPMMMNRRLALRFPQRGIYRLGTKTAEMRGAMDVKTIGPDNNLRLVVTVA